MNVMRASNAADSNPQIQERQRRKGHGNMMWLAQALGEQDAQGAVLLIGGSGPIDFRLRVAQSHARQDLLPSFWSHAAIVRGPAKGADWDLYEACLDPVVGFGHVPRENGVQPGKLSNYDDTDRYPNIACIRFARTAAPTEPSLEIPEELDRLITTFRRQRNVIDLGALFVEWLGFVWGAGVHGNPLLRGLGVPSAVLVESVYAIAGRELTPGVSSQSTCPEAIWQSAKWWHGFYRSEVGGSGDVPSGVYCLGQKAAAVLE